MSKRILLKSLLGAFVALLLICSGSVSVLSTMDLFYDEKADQKMLIRITSTDQLSALPVDAEIISEQPGQWADVIIPARAVFTFAQMKISYSILLSDVEHYSRSVAGSYHTLAQMEQALQSMAETYPGITQLKSIGTTYEGRSIWCLEITDNPGIDENEPGVFFMGVHHAREWPTLEICLSIAEKLTANYGVDPLITELVNSRRIWVTPCMNPDGYYYCHDQGHDWRKNRHYFPQFGTYGVDVNRNYAGSSNGESRGAWGSVWNGGASHSPSSEVYCGPFAFSENETRAIRSLFLENNISASITYHNYGEVILPPWSYTSAPTPDSSYLRLVAQQIVSRITKDSGVGTYSVSGGGGTTGDMTDWAYGYSHYVQGKPTFAYTIEACSEFQPPAGKLDQICSENYQGALYLLQEAANISQVSSRVLPPKLCNMTWDADGNYTVSWREQNPSASPTVFSLDELSGFSLQNDSAEYDNGLWVFDGFTRNSSSSSTGEYGYHSRNRTNDVSSMTSLYPVPVTEGMTLSFWCRYSIEPNHDYGVVEVSTNGRLYDILDTFTGSSENWTYKQYDLHPYAGRSVFIRFRYTTDDRITYEGLFLDNIAPVASFTQKTTLSTSITSHSYQISGKTNGTYYYKVNGYNTARGWGDYSTLKNLRVGNTTLQLHIQSPKTHALYLGNQKILPFFITLIFGKITVSASVSDSADVSKVEFYVDSSLRSTVLYQPYNWTWSSPSFFRHTLKVVAYRPEGASSTAEQKVWKFF